jgi:guanidinoacetate N-methyltransferase
VRREFQRFSVAVEGGEGAFASFPTPFQRDWILGRALREFADDLEHLADVGPRLIPGVERPPIERRWEASDAGYDPAELVIQGQQVMQAWERPLMKRLAEGAARTHGDVLEIGFGMAISATFLQEVGVRSYTIVECNEEVIAFFERWKRDYPGRDIRLVQGRWQDVVDQLGSYDGILFDTYPLSQEEYLQNEVAGTAYTHAGEFFPVAAAKLRPGGVFTYFTCEIDTLSRGHQRELLRHFDSFAVSVVRDLHPPADCQYWWADSMAVVEATRGQGRER